MSNPKQTTLEEIDAAITSLCDDISLNTDAEQNHLRAQAILMLSFSKIFIGGYNNGTTGTDSSQNE